ncbi:hypothetical protein E3Q04_01751 [Wallemia mellicola]|nr:hypothetical protein E3Q04_01751 [Wallemia mellicola]
MSKYRYDDPGVVGRKTGIRIGNVAKDADGLENLDDFFAEGLETNDGVFNDLDFGNDNDNDKRVNYSYNNDSSAMDIVNSEPVSPKNLLSSSLRRQPYASQPLPNDDHSDNEIYNEIPKSQPLPSRRQHKRKSRPATPPPPQRDENSPASMQDFDEGLPDENDNRESEERHAREEEQARIEEKKQKEHEKKKASEIKKRDKEKAERERRRKERRAQLEREKKRQQEEEEENSREQERLSRLKSLSKGKKKQVAEEHSRVSPSPIPEEQYPEPEPEAYPEPLEDIQEEGPSREASPAVPPKRQRRRRSPTPPQSPLPEGQGWVAKTTSLTRQDSNYSDQIGTGVRRSKRRRIRPLASWALERTDFYGNVVGGPPIFNQSHFVDEGEKKRHAKETAKKREKEKEAEYYRTLDEKTKPAVLIRDDQGKEFKKDLVFTAKRSHVGKIKEGKLFEFKKFFTEPDHMASGLLVIDKDKHKPSKSSGDNTYVFYVIEGAAKIIVHESQFVVCQGGTFNIPRFNVYSIINYGLGPLKMFFTQIRIPPNNYNETDEVTTVATTSPVADGSFSNLTNKVDLSDNESVSSNRVLYDSD